MSAAHNVSQPESEPYWRLATHGITLLLNNRQQEAESLFRMYPDSTVMFTGYAISVFMDALMTFEDEKLAAAVHALNELGKRCDSTTGWLSKSGIFHSKRKSTYADHLETQILKADSELYLATLTFLQQNFTGYFNGATHLRHSWIHYRNTYNEILRLYRKIVGELPDEETLQMNCSSTSTRVNSSSESGPSSSAANNENTEPSESSSIEGLSTADISSICLKEDTGGSRKSSRNNLPKSHTTIFSNHNNLAMATSSSSDSLQDNNASPTMPKSQSVQSALSKYTQIGFTTINSNIQYISSTLNPFNYLGMKKEVDKESITRLMCAVSFGYGVLQLGMSLLPPSVLRLSRFFGFECDRSAGLRSLMYARCGSDMHSPMATLALLWYHTIVRPFYALDGNNVQAGVDIAVALIDTAMETYSESAVFLFFKGLVERLRCDIPTAIASFVRSIEQTNHREIQLLSQYEIGWCHLIELDLTSVVRTFLYLRNQSRWSRCFYTYVAIVAACAHDAIAELGDLRPMLAVLNSNPRGYQQDDFLLRRFRICPKTEETLRSRHVLHWKMLLFELLYLWNALPCCNADNLHLIMEDCLSVQQDLQYEPFEGLSHLILGTCHCIQRDSQNGINEFRACLGRRQSCPYDADDAYISAFALYELGYLLIRNDKTHDEGRKCLNEVSKFKTYDFEQRLSVRINSILKHL